MTATIITSFLTLVSFVSVQKSLYEKGFHWIVWYTAQIFCLFLLSSSIFFFLSSFPVFLFKKKKVNSVMIPKKEEKEEKKLHSQSRIYPKTFTYWEKKKGTKKSKNNSLTTEGFTSFSLCRFFFFWYDIDVT